MDRCDQIRQSALAFAVEFSATSQQFDPGAVVYIANRFHKFLLGGHESLTEKDVVEMEAVIRQDEREASNVRTFTGRPVELPSDVEGAA
jgi:hypothetical protein